MSPVTHKAKVGKQPLPLKVATAIDASLNELQRLTEEAAGKPEAFEPKGSIPYPYRTPDVSVVCDGELKAVTRTERRDDQYHLDVNVSVDGLDEYEVAAVVRVFTLHLRSAVAAARQENSEARITQLLRAVAPPDPLADIELKIAEDTADLRREFLERVPVGTSAEVHKHAGFPGSNPSQTVLRWRKQGKIFSISHGGRELYPSFQFGDDGRPRPIVAELLQILARDKDRSEWDNALWFAADSGWLEGKTPIDLLQSQPQLVKQAAEQEALRDEP